MSHLRYACRIVVIVCAALASVAHAGRDGNAEAWAAYRSRPVFRPVPSHWTLFAPEKVIFRRSMNQVNRLARQELDLHQHGRGRDSGNVCGYYATYRISALFGAPAPKVGDIFNTWYTTPNELTEYINSGYTAPGLRADRNGYSDGEYFDYMWKVRQAIDHGHPCIILLCFGGMSDMHYVVVVGYHIIPNAGRGRTDFLVLDYGGLLHMTENEFYRLSYNPAPFHKAYNAIYVWYERNNDWGSSSVRQGASSTRWAIDDVDHGKVALRAPNGMYLSVHPNGFVDVSPHRSMWETFETIVHLDGKISLRSAHGSYVQAHDDGSIRTAPHAQAWESFELLGSSAAAQLRSHHGQLIGYEEL